jgi:hypothetical protein
VKYTYGNAVRVCQSFKNKKAHNRRFQPELKVLNQFSLSTKDDALEDDYV